MLDATPPCSTRRTPTWLRRLPPLALALAAVIWGVTFTVVDSATALLPPADLVCWRFGLGTLVLTVLQRGSRPMPDALRRRGLLLGGLLGAGFLLQAWALTYTDALMSGFLTSLLVVIAPLAGWLLFRDRLSRSAGVGIGLATAGVAALGFHTAGFGPGELLTIASAAVWGLHVVLLSRWARAEHAVQLARTQTAAVTVLALAAVVVRAVARGGSPWPVLPPSGAAWLSVGFLAVLASAVAMVLMSWSQARLSATRASVILTLEPAVSGVTAAVTGSELTGRTLLGAALLITAMVVVELGGRGVPVRVGRRAATGDPSSLLRVTNKLAAHGVRGADPGPGRGVDRRPSCVSRVAQAAGSLRAPGAHPGPRGLDGTPGLRAVGRGPAQLPDLHAAGLHLAAPPQHGRR
jgi:drug/metabolite transporter (DMT)-like permease